MELTQEQQDFLNEQGKQITLCASPGSGKTFVVAQKLIKYMGEWKFCHRGIAAISFTNIASEEVKRQIANSEYQKTEIGYPHFCGTLDSFINNFIFLRFGYLLMKDRKRPQIIYDGVLQTMASLFKRRHSLCYKNGCVQHPEWFHWTPNEELLKNGKPIECKIPVFPRPCLQAKQKLLEQGKVSQHDVTSFSKSLLEQYPKIAEILAYRFPVIIVDEVQDTSQEQAEIIDRIAKQNGIIQISLVGDPDQSLYEWRNATPEYFIEKMNSGDWKSMYLSANFRSSQLICNAVRLFSKTLENRPAACAKGECAKYQIKPMLFLLSSDKTEDCVIETFLETCKQYDIKISHKNVAVLTRATIHKVLVSDVWQTTETELLAKATYFYHCLRRQEAYMLCEKALYSIEFGDVTGLTHEEIILRVEKRIPILEWRSKVISVLRALPSPDLSVESWTSKITSNIADLMNNGASITPRDDRKVGDIIKTKQRSRKNPDFLQQPLKSYFEKKVEAEYTRSSVHGVKGETFDAILLIVNAQKGNTLTPTILNTRALDDELIRIAYVAMTRPRKLLAVSMPKSKCKLSRFPKDLWNYIEV